MELNLLVTSQVNIFQLLWQYKTMYYIYHIPGKKIGVTRNLFIRVTKQQGYKPNEYEVLDQSEDINYISDREIELQQSYGYKIDRIKYKNVVNKMNINPTDQTTTFPVPVNKLKGALMDNLGIQWDTWLGKFEISDKTIDIDFSIGRQMHRCWQIEFKKS